MYLITTVLVNLVRESCQLDRYIQAVVYPCGVWRYNNTDRSLSFTGYCIIIIVVIVRTERFNMAYDKLYTSVGRVLIVIQTVNVYISLL